MIDFTQLLQPVHIAAAASAGIDLNEWNNKINSQITEWIKTSFLNAQQPIVDKALSAYIADPQATGQAVQEFASVLEGIVGG